MALALMELVHVDLVGLRGFKALQRAVCATRVRGIAATPDIVDRVVLAVRVASMFYVKTARCLQRAAVATRLLRRYGVPAHLIIGCQPAPVRSHAWVEVDGRVVSDRIHGLQFYRRIDCW